MTAMNYQQVYNAFAPLVTNFASSEGVDKVAYPGLHFDPPSEGLWLEIKLSANDGTEYGVSDDGPSEAMGFFRVLVCDRPGTSITGALSTAEALASAIPKGTQIGPARIYQTPRISGVFEEDDRVMHAVTFRFRGARYV